MILDTECLVDHDRHWHVQQYGTVLSMAFAQDTLFVTFQASNAVHKIERVGGRKGQLEVFAGDCRRSGHCNQCGISARFDSPQALLAVDSGFLVADSNNHCIRRVYGHTKCVTDFAIGFGIAYPSHLAHCGNDILVADSNRRRILCISLDHGVFILGCFHSPCITSIGADGDIDKIVYFTTSEEYFGAAHSLWVLRSDGSYTSIQGGIGFKDGTESQALFSNNVKIASCSAHGMLLVDAGNNAVRCLHDSKVTTVIDLLRRSIDGGPFIPIHCIEDPTQQNAYFVSVCRHHPDADWDNFWGVKLLRIVVQPCLQTNETIQTLQLSSLDSPEFSDVTFVVQDRQIHCVRAVLCVTSEYFRAHLSHSGPEVIYIHDATSQQGFRATSLILGCIMPLGGLRGEGNLVGICKFVRHQCQSMRCVETLQFGDLRIWKSQNLESGKCHYESRIKVSMLPKTATGFGLLQTVPPGPSLFMQFQPIGFHGPRTEPEYKLFFFALSLLVVQQMLFIQFGDFDAIISPPLVGGYWYDAFHCVLEFLVVGTVKLTAATVIEVHGLADRFLLPSLKLECLDQLGSCLTLATGLDLVDKVRACKDDDLRERVFILAKQRGTMAMQPKSSYCSAPVVLLFGVPAYWLNLSIQPSRLSIGKYHK